ncbi:MAG: isoprenylcysteine carboxylmethyltransferase family protein [bacterium]|nr:isoprenylcysteine carboxylmethyltransferase family protein [bacterium]
MLDRTAVACLATAFFVGLAFVWRSWMQWRRTGSTGFRGIHGRPLSPEWWGGVLFVVGCAATVAAPVLAWTGAAPPWPPLARPATLWAGLALVAVGTAGTLWAQLAMGTSWRIGVDPSERTALVTDGPFRWVRNPIFTAMLIGLAGLLLLVPGPLATLAFAITLAGVELQVRTAEEPYLVRTHGAAYLRWAARTGRFLPGVGRLAGMAPPATAR